MLEHVSGLYMKVQFEQNKLWERHENSICFTNNIQMKKIIITKTTSRLACRCCQMATRVANWQQRHARRLVFICNNYVQQTDKITLLGHFCSNFCEIHTNFMPSLRYILFLYIRFWKIIFHLLYYHNHKNNMSSGVSLEPFGNAFKIICQQACRWSQMATGEISIDDKLVFAGRRIVCWIG